MKYAKRFVAALLAVLMLAALLAVPGMAEAGEDQNPNPNSTTDQDPNPVPVTYGTVQFDLTSLGLQETLTVQDEDYPNPAVTYTLTLGEMRVFQQGMHYMNSDTALEFAPSDATITAAKKALDGKTLATVTFGAGEIPYKDNNITKTSKTKPYDEASGILDAINNLEFDRPCIIYWPVIKKSSFTDTETDHLSNYDHNKLTDGTTGTVLILRVDDTGNAVDVPVTEGSAETVKKEILETTLGFQSPETIDLWNLAVMHFLSKELGDSALVPVDDDYSLWRASDFDAFWNQAKLEEVINRFDIEYYFRDEVGINPDSYPAVLPFERLLKFIDANPDEIFPDGKPFPSYSHSRFIKWYLSEGEGFDDFWADHDGTAEEVAAVVNRDKLAAYYVDHPNELETADTSVYDLSDLLQYLRTSYFHDAFLEWYLTEGEALSDFLAAASHQGTKDEVDAVKNGTPLAAYYEKYPAELESAYDDADLSQYLAITSTGFPDYLLNGNGDTSIVSFENLYPDWILIQNSEPPMFPNGVSKADVVAVLDGQMSLYDFYLEYPSEFARAMYSFALSYDDANRVSATADTNYPNNYFSNFPYVFLATEEKIDGYEDEHFPTNTLDVTKLVDGTQGRKDQYFKFTVVLLVDREKQVTRADLAAWADQLDFTGSANSVNTATPKYGELFIDAEHNQYDNLNPEIRIKLPKVAIEPYDKPNDNWFGNDSDNDYHTIKMPSSTKGWIEIDFWLKHGETFQIGNIPSDLNRFAAFERPSVEGDSVEGQEYTNGFPKTYYLDGYLVSNEWRYTDNEGEEITEPGPYTVNPVTQERIPYHHYETWSGWVYGTDVVWPEFAADTTNDKVIFTNEKEASTPTGVLLQAAAPIAGMVLAAALGAVLLLSRKRRRGGGDA